MSSSVRHLKLVTGEELICDILDESPESIVVNNALSLIANSGPNGEKFYTFKTYMVYQDTPMNCILVFTDKIMSLAIPAKDMTEQYYRALKEMEEFLEDNSLVDDYEDSPQSIEDWLEELEALKNDSENLH